jgi:iron complex outermembrane receptor protein
MQSLLLSPFHSLLFLLIANAVLAQVTVNGRVTDATSSPIAGATVSVSGTSFRVMTDADGQFEIYIPESGKAFIVKAGKRTQAFFLQNESPVVLVMPKEKVKGLISPWSQRTVSGIVLDDVTGEPLAGATVIAEGTNFKAMTGSDGIFQLYLPINTQAFRVKYGHRSALFPLAADEFFTFRLPAKMPGVSISADSLLLQKAIRQTGAAVALSHPDFNHGHLNDPLQLVQGKVAGLAVARAGDNPNEPFAIRLRGMNTFNQRAEPLLVVDGFPESSLQIIDPLDVAGIRVIKDAATSARYGMRGNNGVVEIETFRSQQEGLRLNYQASIAQEQVAKYWPVASAGRFRQFPTSIDEGGETDWQQEISQKALQVAHLLGISGSSSHQRYHLSLGYRSAQGTLKKTGFQNLNARLHVTQNAWKNRLRLHATLGLNGRNADDGFPGAWHDAITYNPTAPIRGTDLLALAHAGYFTRFQANNPVALIEQNSHKTNTLTWQGQLAAELNLWAGIALKTQFTRQQTDLAESRIAGEMGTLRGIFSLAAAEERRMEVTNDFFRGSLNRQFDFHRLTTNWEAGYTFQRLDNQVVFNEISNFNHKGSDFGDLRKLTLAPGETLLTSLHGNVHDLVAWFSNASFEYDNFLFVDAALRREGSSRLGVNQKWGNFYGVCVGSNLAILLKTNWLDYLKPRISFGRTGNTPADPGLSLEKRGLVDIGQEHPIVQVFTVANPDLKWESKTEGNFGLDLSLFNRRLFGSLDIFRSTAGDLIRPNINKNTLYVPDTTWTNSVELSNRGHEWSLGMELVRRSDFSWQTGFQFARVRTRLEKRNGDDNLEGAVLLEQEFYQVNRFVEEAPFGQLASYVMIGGNPFVLRDYDGNGLAWGPGDERPTGNGLPERMFSFSSSIQWKNLDFSFLLRRVSGHSLLGYYRFDLENANVFWENALLTEGFRDEQGAYLLSDYHIEKADFTRLQYATLGYRLGLKKDGLFKSLRMALTAQHLFTISDYKGLDPEVRFNNHRRNSFYTPLRKLRRPHASLPGIDEQATWLPSRTWALCVQASF